MDSRDPLLVLQLSMRSPEGLIEAPENQFYWFAAQTQKTSQVQEWCWSWLAAATVQWWWAAATQAIGAPRALIPAVQWGDRCRARADCEDTRVRE